MATSYVKTPVALTPVVDVGFQIDRGRLQVGVAELGLEIVEGYAHVKRPNCVEMQSECAGGGVTT